MMQQNVWMQPEYLAGYREARSQVMSGDIYDVPEALILFSIDPPHNEFALGMRDGLIAINSSRLGTVPKRSDTAASVVPITSIGDSNE